MKQLKQIFDSRKYYHQDRSFRLLMQKRIYQVLLVCSTYDAFMLEEDGRIDEQIFNEYVSLNLRYPPRFILASNHEEALKILHRENIDLIITMLSIDDPLGLTRKIKNKYPKKPVVVLFPFSREVTERFNIKEFQIFDHSFFWLGNADILLAIIKVIEDKMNVSQDVEEVGVQSILLVEDSVRFYSSYLPVLYKTIFEQSKEFTTEGLNEHQKMLRMRGRPKILLAHNFEEAIDYYQKYKNNMLGIITDMSYKKDGVTDPKAGEKLCRIIREDDEYLPVLIQSSEIENEALAYKLNAKFLNKNSKTLSIELRDFINEYMVFGDFIFRDPVTHEEITRAPDLQTLQMKIFEIPDESLKYHIERNHFSKWLNARALFSLGEAFKYVRPEDFQNIEDVKRFLFDHIATYRLNKARGIIAEFNRESFDEYIFFSRIGEGSLGGKARGLAFIDSLIKRNQILDRFDNVLITIPRTTVLTTDVFDEFMEDNKLYKIALSELSDDEILKCFVKARLPFRIHEDLSALINVVRNPIAIRSSSLLEDSYYQPFAGIYSTYMIPRVDDERKMLEMLSCAIKSVYASVFFKASKAYMTATANVIDEEKMAIILQEVCGNQYGNVFYPTISGVARSTNFYPIFPEKSEEGIVNLAFGLGKYIVDGGVTIRFSPYYPKKIIQLSSPEMALRESQRYFSALDMDPENFYASTDDGVNILKIPLKDAENHPALRFVTSTYDYNNHILRDSFESDGKKVITFSKILNYNVFPLADVIKTLLQIGEKEMNKPVEIEFAANLDVPDGYPMIFNFLQIRPIVDNKESIDSNLEEVNPDDAVIVSNLALGNGIYDDVYDVVYVKTDAFNAANNLKTAEIIEKINQQYLNEKRKYALVGPGRWGSSDAWLGIPVKWPHISAARLIVESGLDNYRVDPSQGTHFFHNLTSFRVGYFTINPYINDGTYDLEFLNHQPAYYEDDSVRVVKFTKPLIIKIDGKKSIGVMLKPQPD
jgi:hypothetical protein